MQLDQCLSCSRYEPVIGQTYEILNETGTNLANIEDDMQAGMMNMQEYMDFVQIDRMHTMKKDYQFNYKTTSKRNENEQDFDDVWDPGVKMNWMYTPVEKQKPQINWRQDINSADKSPKKLDSYQGANGAAQGNDPGVTLTPGNYKSSVDAHKKYMDDVLAGKHDKEAGDSVGATTTDDKKDTTDKTKKDDKTKTSGRIKNWMVSKDNNSSGSSSETDHAAEWQKVKDAINKGFQSMPQNIIDDAVANLKNYGYEQELQNQCAAAKIDPVMMMAIATVVSTGDPSSGDGLFGTGVKDDIKEQIKEGLEKYKGFVDKYNKGGNPLGPIQAWKAWGDNLDKLNIEKRMFDVKWVEATEKDNSDSSFFPAIITAYIGVDKANTGLSQLKDNATNIDFPLATDKLNETFFVQDFGVTNVDTAVAAVSNAIIFKLPAGSELHAPEKCTSTKMMYDDKIGNYIELTGTDTKDVYTFGGLNSVNDIKEGDEVPQNQVVAVSGEKLILQVKSNGSYVDPKTTWPKINGLKVSESDSIGNQISNINIAGSKTDTSKS